ncbi:MAG: 16S rRNA (adenine(1518)-N(6)/adenine(1519)-N(6))-dimethyltransferase RsmA [Nitrososphaeria archaeon]|jgi:16S rRNA (adenine1518-N6/adenine1519-N6)-dimethyltransferase
MQVKHGQRLGQNFIADPYYLDRILSVAELNCSDIVLEIGTGYGDLTERLCKISDKVISYEIDRRLFSLAKERLSSCTSLVLVNGNGLKCDYFFNKIVSNLPYAISKDFIYWLMEKDIISATVILQKDFVEKLLAQPKAKNFRALSVIAQLSFKISVFDEVPPEAFNPIPKVYSSIVKFEPVNPQVINIRLRKQINLLFTFRGKKVNSVLKRLLKKPYDLPREVDLIRDERIEHLPPKSFLTLGNFLLSSVKAD